MAMMPMATAVSAAMAALRPNRARPSRVARLSAYGTVASRPASARNMTPTCNATSRTNDVTTSTANVSHAIDVA